LACAELCGLGHYKMRAFVEVMTEDDFDKWLKGMAAAQ
jgi:heme/copper-type cytochrome/quinol oxidase subunit 2